MYAEEWGSNMVLHNLTKYEKMYFRDILMYNNMP